MNDHQPTFLAYRSFYTPLNTIEHFARIGYDTICLFPAHTVNSRGTPYSQYGPVWLWHDRLDFAPVDDMVYAITRAMPKAKFICMIDMNSPVWLEHYHHDSCNDSFNNLGKVIHNPQWRKPTEHYLKSFLQTMEERYGNRISAYVLCCGATDEWYDYSNGTESMERRIAWRKWCLQHGLPDPVDIPPLSARSHGMLERFLSNPLDDEKDMNRFKMAGYEQADSPLGSPGEFLYDPVSYGHVVDYWRFCNESVADSILNFASIARKLIRPETQIGCFYGYILEKGFQGLVSCGHLAYEKVMDSPDVDFLISPGTYTSERCIGGGSGFLIPNGSMRLRGKHLLHECDQRTHTHNPYLAPDITIRPTTAWPDEASTLAGLKREACLGLLKNTHLWWFDMWGDFYQGEAVMKTLEKIRVLWDRLPRETLADVSEIALVVDPQSTYYMDENNFNAIHVNVTIRNVLNQLGAPFEVYSFQDIPRISKVNQYKLVVFTSLFEITDEKLDILRNYVFGNHRTVLWLLAPGIIANGKLDVNNCQRLTGMPLEQSANLKWKEMSNWTSASLYDYRSLTVSMLRRMATDAGVHMYVDCHCPVYAAGDYLAIHVKEGRALALRVGTKYHRARELFSDQEFSVVGGTFTYDFRAPDTALFELYA